MAIVDNAKLVYELAKKGATLELQEKVMELREEAMTLQEENIQLRTKVQSLEAQLRLRHEPESDGEVYWVTKEDGKRDGPFCQRCFDVNQKLVRLQPARDRTGYDWFCLECESDYGKYVDAHEFHGGGCY